MSQLRCDKCDALWKGAVDVGDTCGVRLSGDVWCDGILREHECGGPQEACMLRNCDECGAVRSAKRPCGGDGCLYRPCEVIHDGKAITVMNSADSHRLSAALEELYALRDVAAIADDFIPKCEETTYDEAAGQSRACGKRATHMDRFRGFDTNRLCAEHAELALASANRAESKGCYGAVLRDAPRALVADERVDRLEEALSRVPK